MTWILALHLCAHFGAGNMIGAGTEVLTSLSGLDKDRPYLALGVRLAVPAVIGFIKESEDKEFSTPELLATIAGGGLALNYHF